MSWKNSAEQCLEQMTALTVKEAITAPSPAYGFIYQDNPTKAKAILSIQIAELIKAFNVGKSMDKFQIGQCVNIIFDDNNLRCLKPDDFKVCFTNMIKGHYGKSYDRMDAQVIFEALNSYLAERLETVEEISMKKHELEKAGKMAKIDKEGQIKVLEILKKAIPNEPVKTPEIKVEVKKEKIKPVKTERDNYIQNCFAEFFEIWKYNPVKTKSGKFIEYNGKIVDEVEYVQLKVSEYDKTNV